jgi:SAM-dependent methyltransferase
VNSAYWDRLAPRFDEEIFHTLLHDRRGKILSALKKASSKYRSVVDLGCGIGRCLPHLSKFFGRVVGIDFSAACLARASELVASMGNVTLIHADASRYRGGAGTFDVAVAINSVIAGSAKTRKRILRTANALLKQRGLLLLVVPAFESLVWEEQILGRSSLTAGSFYSPSKQFPWDPTVVVVDGIPTKYFVREEILHAISDAGYSHPSISRVEYSWQALGIPVPKKTMPVPWDWLAVASKA